MVDVTRRPGGELVAVIDTPSRALTPVEQLAQTGVLGDDVAVLLRAAEQFAALATQAQLRGRLGQSSLVQNQQIARGGPEAINARRALARVYEAIGGDLFNVLVDVCVWHQPVPGRAALLRAALFAMHRCRQRALC